MYRHAYINLYNACHNNQMAPMMSVPMTTTTLQRLINSLVSPAVFDFWAGKLNPVWTWERTLAEVVEVCQEARNAVSLVLRPNHHFTGFQPGQHINVTAEINGARVTRSYSFTDVPQADGGIRLTVRRNEGGKLSNHLCDVIRVGDVLELGKAFGGMTLDAASPGKPEGKFLFLAAGSGITPLMSLTRALAVAGMPVDVTLIYWARTRAELCFAKELKALSVSMPRFQVHFMLTREAPQQNSEQCGSEHLGRISHTLLRELASDLHERHVYTCGPAGFVDAVRELAGTKARSFHAEAFTAPVLDVATNTATGTVRVELAISGRTLEIPAGQSLLTALEAQGVNPAYGCRIGICNTCACGKSSGTTQDLNSGDYSAEPTAALRLCISRVSTDLTLDL